MNFRPAPNRPFRRELAPLFSVALAVACVAALLPRQERRIPGAAAGGPRSAEPGCAFIVLDEAREREILEAARTAWQSVSRRRRGPEPLPRVLPDFPPTPIAGAAPAVPDAPAAVPETRLLPPTSAAAAPEKIPAAPGEAARKPFPRELLLRMD